MHDSRRLLRSVCLGLALLAAGCGGQGHTALVAVAETDEPQYQQGEQLLKEGNPDEALAQFLALIKTREDDAPESHLEAGRIYLANKNDPIAAIYHFKAFLTAKPNADQAPMVAEMIDTAQKKFAQSLPGAPNIYDEAALLDQIKSLQADNDNLRRELGGQPLAHATLASPPNPPPATVTAVNAVPAQPAVVTPAPVVVTPVPAQKTAATPAPTVSSSGRTYTVVAGDTLYSISYKIYGSRSRWQDIYNLNRDQLPKPESLHIGQVLKLPAQ